MNDPFQPFTWKLAHGRNLTLGPKGMLMVIINVTPDSFSDGGQFFSAERAVERGEELVREGTTRIFKWTGQARDYQLYKQLCDAGFKIAAE